MSLAFFKNKKGNAVVDGVVIVIILFVLAIVFITAYYTFDQIKPDLDLELTDPVANQSMNTLHTQLPNTFDGMFAAILVLLWIGAVILAYFIDTHPVFFIFTLILLIVVFIVVGILSNTFGEYNAELGMSSTFPMITYVMNHFLHFVMGFVFSIVIALFAKSQTT